VTWFIEWDTAIGPCPIQPRSPWFKRLCAFAERQAVIEAENARLKTLLTRMYNKGYKAGHHATVEGQYVDILDEDMDTYHDDIVNEILSE
jgi:hypothetical protein